jgi:hypothetical protein
MARQKLSHPEMKIPLFVHMVLEKLANNPLTFSEQVRAVTVGHRRCFLLLTSPMIIMVRCVRVR